MKFGECMGIDIILKSKFDFGDLDVRRLNFRKRK